MRRATTRSEPRSAIGLFAGLLLAGFVAPVARADSPDLVEAGRRLYQEGILPNGKPLVGTRPEGLVLRGERAACATCHRRSGMGSIEGIGDDAILVPPLAGPVMFKPARWADHYLDEPHHYVPNATWRRAMKRPAYDEQSLGVALRKGPNTMGQYLEAPMPRYDLDRRSLAALTTYLRTLGATPDPGAEGDELHVGVVIASDADPEDARVVLDVVRAWTASPVRYGGKRTGHPRPIRVHEWRLTGSAETWSKQLREAYGEQPVFALLSGVGRSEWEPVHEFCEQQKVPCILPSVDVAPNAEGHYAMYFSPGVALEAKILAEHLAENPPRGGRVVQIYGDAASREAAAELDRRLEGSGVPAETRRFRVIAPSLSMDGISGSDIVVLWLRPEALSLLSLSVPEGPASELLYFSATLATPEQVSLPESWRDRARFVSLDDEVSVQREIARLRLARWLDKQGLSQEGDRRVQADAYVAGYVFNAALSNIKRQEFRRPAVALMREHVLEQLETLVSRRADGRDVIDEDLHVAYYGRMSLGPDQRVATRGGSIVKFKAPDSNGLVHVSERITPR